MTRPLMLAIWVVCGLAAAALLAPPGTPRLAWAPIAVILGPLWVLVALEQRYESDESLGSSAAPRPGRIATSNTACADMAREPRCGPSVAQSPREPLVVATATLNVSAEVQPDESAPGQLYARLRVGPGVRSTIGPLATLDEATEAAETLLEDLLVAMSNVTAPTGPGASVDHRPR